jgi:hypothetical protein
VVRPLRDGWRERVEMNDLYCAGCSPRMNDTGRVRVACGKHRFVCQKDRQELGA